MEILKIKGIISTDSTVSKMEGKYKNQGSTGLKNTEKPKGVLVAIEGNEDKRDELQILSAVLSLAKAERKKNEIITSASLHPKKICKDYYQAFTKDTNHSVGLMHISTRKQAFDVQLLERITAADIIFFSGGDQLRITSVLGGSPKRNHRSFHGHGTD